MIPGKSCSTTGPLPSGPASSPSRNLPYNKRLPL
jgi:hypothetical protein